MEIYRNQPTTIKFRAPIPDGSYTIKVISARPGGVPYEQTITTIAPTADVYLGNALEVPVGFEHTWYDGRITFEITVNGGSPTVQHTYKEFVDVVTPLFTWADLGAAYPQDKTPELERLVRHVIEAYTGQRFGLSIETHQLSTGASTTYFDVPLIEFTGVSDRYMTGTTTLNPPKMSYEFVQDNYGIYIDWTSDLYDPKTDSLWILGDRVPTAWVTMEGIFGYESVPADVKEAALLIAGSWGCKQTLWRDRYIQTMRSGDWSVQYHGQTFAKSTGSVTADNLLAKYAQRGMTPEVI